MATPNMKNSLVEASRRSRMISLRISEEEYHNLKQYRQEYGARSLSELARIALHRITGNTSPEAGPVQFRLNEFDSRLKAIESRMAEMASAKP